jgi:hypothetical protein
MPILICAILDGVIEKPKEGTIAIVERGMTAVGYPIDNSDCLKDETTTKQITEKYKQINSSYFLDHTIVPFNFGNIVHDEEEVRQFLINATIELKALIDKLKGKEQIIIHISFDVQKAIMEISKSVDVSNKIAVGKAFFELSEKHKKAIRQALKSKLSIHAADYTETPIVNETAILLNTYLVEKTKKELFDNALDEIAEKCDDFIAFNYIGPLPPYDFVDTDFNRGNFDMINEARLVLGLKEQCTFDDIKSSYRKMSFTVHPDKNKGDDKKMKALNEAYRIVKAYCNSGNESECSFAKEAIERSFVHY